MATFCPHCEGKTGGNMKQKLWIAWGIFSILSLVALSVNVFLAYSMAFIAAGFGWACFFKYY